MVSPSALCFGLCVADTSMFHNVTLYPNDVVTMRTLMVIRTCASTDAEFAQMSNGGRWKWDNCLPGPISFGNELKVLEWMATGFRDALNKVASPARDFFVVALFFSSRSRILYCFVNVVPTTVPSSCASIRALWSKMSLSYRVMRLLPHFPIIEMRC